MVGAAKYRRVAFGERVVYGVRERLHRHGPKRGGRAQWSDSVVVRRPMPWVPDRDRLVSGLR